MSAPETKPPLEDILKIDDEVLAILGVTRDEMAGMGMRTLIDLAHDKGYDISVDSRPSEVEGGGRATVTVGHGENAGIQY